MSRPPAAITQGPGVFIPWWACRALEDRAQLRRMRIAIRESDPDLYGVLLAISVGAAAHGADQPAASGTRSTPKPEVHPDSELVDADCVAAQLHITIRWARQLLADGTIPARKLAGRWTTTRQHLNAHLQQRNAA